MTTGTSIARLVGGALGAAVFSLPLAQARAQALTPCVVCDHPAASYRCVIAEQGQLDAAKGGERAAHFVCISELARLGGHGSCRVRRDLVASCDAPDRVVSLSSYAKPGAEAASAAGAPPAAPAGSTAEPVPAPPTGPPQTLVELAERTATASKQQLQQAGSAVDTAARTTGSAIGKTWSCLTSLFQDCGAAPAGGEPRKP